MTNKVNEITLYFDEIDCIACSKKIETNLNNDDKLSDVVIDYLNKEIHLNYVDLTIEELIEKVNNIAHKTEPDVNISLKKGKKEHIILYFDEIDCIACSKKVEEILNKCDKLENVVINYLEKEIHLDYYDLSTDELIELVNKEAK